MKLKKCDLNRNLTGSYFKKVFDINLKLRIVYTDNKVSVSCPSLEFFLNAVFVRKIELGRK